MSERANHGSAGDHHSADVGQSTGELPDLHWASTQRRLAVAGTLLSLIGVLAATFAGPLSGEAFRLLAWIGALVLAVCCGVNAWCWHGQIRRWRAGSDDGYRRRAQLSLVAHLVSYVAVLIGMYGALEASALAGWTSTAGTLLGIDFIVIIFGQILGGSQLLRRSGPPGTIPTYLRKLNAKVQSLR
jgi:hypothetical protein